MYLGKRALYISAKEPYISPQKSPIYLRKTRPGYLGALCICNSAVYIRRRALYISVKEPYISPQNSPGYLGALCICNSAVYIRRRALYISAKETYISLQKALYISAKEPYISESPIFPQKRPTSPQKYLQHLINKPLDLDLEP